MAKNTKTGLRNNYGIHDTNFWSCIEDYKEAFIEDNGYEPSETELFQYASDSVSDNYDELISSIRYHQQKYGAGVYIVKAKLGLWNGLRDGGKVIVGMVHVISECAEDLDQFKVEFINGQMHISGYHHDGANHFYIRQLTDKGKEYAFNHQYLDERTLHKRLFNSSKYSKRVDIFDKMWFLPES